MRVFVTGGAGFIGSHTVEGLLEAGHEVTVWDDLSTGKRANLAAVADRVELLTGDVRDLAGLQAAVRRAGAEAILHLAAIPSVPRSVEEPTLTHAVNLTGTVNVLETARREGIGTPIVVVSARGTEHDRIHALEIGADDYLVKPFSMKELVARVRVAARRGVRREESPRGEPIEIEELLIDPREVQAYVRGESADLTPTEFRLLYQLALDRGRVVTRDELLQKIWGRRETHRDRTVDVFVRRLREKIDRHAPRHTFVQTRYGVGYRLEPLLKD